jgi:hypothetical protein
MGLKLKAFQALLPSFYQAYEDDLVIHCSSSIHRAGIFLHNNH